MLLGTVQPSIIDRARWQNWRTIPSYPVEDHLFYQAYLQAIAFSCPQICIFDGFTLISMNVYGITAQDVSAANCRAEADIVFDYLYDGRGPPTHEPLNTRNLNDDAIEGAGYRGTIREAVFDALMDGVRRVACTRLTPQGPHPIPVLDVLGFQKRVRRDIGTVYYYSARESAGQESASRESAPQPSLFRRALQHFFSGPPPADQEDTEATAPMDQSIILESVDLLSDGGNVRSDGTLRMVFMFHCLEPRCWAPLCDPF
ncbi:hypothetical protein BDV97DRAFT_347941 [Delphinella strobiligena]|nr:hypothetical protein BDV97DRAFT_347941 [Delphinella strobiligena]